MGIQLHVALPKIQRVKDWKLVSFIHSFKYLVKPIPPQRLSLFLPLHSRAICPFLTVPFANYVVIFLCPHNSFQKAYNPVCCENHRGQKFGRKGPWRTVHFLFLLCKLTPPNGSSPNHQLMNHRFHVQPYQNHIRFRVRKNLKIQLAYLFSMY